MRAVDNAAAPTRKFGHRSAPAAQPFTHVYFARRSRHLRPTAKYSSQGADRGEAGAWRFFRRQKAPSFSSWAVAAHSCPKWQPFVLRTRVELSREALVCLRWASATWVPDLGPEISRTCSPTPCPGQIRGCPRTL